MPLPDNFSPWEHLQSTVSRVLTRLVREEFSDIGGADWSPEITTPRSSLRVACTPDDKDTAPMMLIRMFLFFFVIRGGADFLPMVYGLLDFAEDVQAQKFPQVQVFYRETRYDATGNDRIPIERRVSFRWRETDWTTAKINALALKIKTDLATPKLIWRTGKEFYTYKDRSIPYEFKVQALNEVEAKKVIEASIRIQDNTEPDWKLLRKAVNTEATSTIPENRMIDGELVKLPIESPLATVEFAYAQLKFPKVRKPYILVDATGTKRGAREYV
jgi:hypothetical protein